LQERGYGLHLLWIHDLDEEDEFMRIPIIALILSFALCGIVSAEDEQVEAPVILSIIPGQGTPGIRVMISGSGFTPESTVYLGIDEIPSRLLSSKQISFEIPQIAPGNYALYVRQKGGPSGRAYSFAISPVKPVAISISPDTISFCSSGDERQITVRGKNFLEGAQILLDGAAIKGSRVSSEEMLFTAPQIQGGLHQIQIRNPEETISGALGLMVTNRPEVRNVSQGSDYVNYYELAIEGINFQQGSSLIVDGKKIQSGQTYPGDRDRLLYNSCSRMTYYRYPYDPSIKSLQMMVVNPNGEESSVFTVSAP
jgi:IPT/TIG domain-containing protein